MKKYMDRSALLMSATIGFIPSVFVFSPWFLLPIVVLQFGVFLCFLKFKEAKALQIR